MAIKLKPIQSSYDRMYSEAARHANFSTDQWSNAVKSNTANVYLDALKQTDSLDQEKFRKDYNLDYADTDRKLTALYNEAYGDRTKLKEYDITDSEGRQQKVNMTEYDYTKYMINARNNYEQQLVDIQRKEMEKEERSSFGKFMGTVLSTFALEPLKGVTDIGRGIISLPGGINEAINQGDFDAFLEGVNNVYRETSGFSDWIDSFESEWTYARNADGSVSSYGEYANAITYTIGQMLPSMLVGHGSSALLQKAGVSASKAGTVASIASKGTFYGAITMGRINEAYEAAYAQGVTVDTGAVLLNATLKSAVEIGIESILGKMFGQTAVDQMRNGTGALRTGKMNQTFTKAGLKRIAKDALQEGLEEIFQDTATWWLDQRFSDIMCDDYWKSLTAGQTDPTALINTFVVSALTSLAGSGYQITKKAISGSVNDALVKRYTKQLEQGVDIENVAKKLDRAKSRSTAVQYTVDGDKVEAKRMNPIAAWEYGIDMQSFIQNVAEVRDMLEEYNELQKSGELDTMPKRKRDRLAREITEGAAQTYTAMQLVTSVYGDMSQEMQTEVNSWLKLLNGHIARGDYNNAAVIRAGKLVTTAVEAYTDTQSALFKKAAAYAEKKQAEAIKAVITNKTEDNAVKEKTSQKAKQIIKNGNVNSVVVTEKHVPAKVVTADGEKALVVDEATLENATPEEIFNNSAEQWLVESTMGMEKFANVQNKILDLYHGTENHGDATMEDAITAILFDKEFFRRCMLTSDLYTGKDGISARDLFDFVRSLSDLITSTPKNLVEAVQNNKLEASLKFMREAMMEYAIVHPQADVESVVELFPVEQREAVRNNIKQNTWFWSMRNRILDGSITDADKETLKRVVQSMPISADAKNAVYQGLLSMDRFTRNKAFFMLETGANKIWNLKYDNVTYPAMVSVPSVLFGQYLKAQRLTLSDMFSDTKLTDADRAYMADRGISSIAELRAEQFNRYAPDYTVEFGTDAYGRRTISYRGSDSLKIEGVNAFGDKIISQRNTMLDERVDVLPAGKQNITKLASDNLSAGVKASLTINDFIARPDLLKPEIQKAIQKEYGRVTALTTRAYLATEYLPKIDSGLTIVEMSDGTFGLGQLTPVKKLFTKSQPKYEKSHQYNITEIIDKKYLPGSLKDITVVFTDQMPNKISADGYYGSYNTLNIGIDNTIYVSNLAIAKGATYVNNVIAHEFQHALEVNNFMATGTATWFTAADAIHDPNFKRVVAELQKYAPEVVLDRNGKLLPSAYLVDAVNDFLYYGSTEYRAFGFSGTEGVKYMPVVVRYAFDKQNGSHQMVLQLPWGTTLTNVGSTAAMKAYSLIPQKNITYAGETLEHKIEYVKTDGNTITVRDPLLDKEIQLSVDESVAKVADIEAQLKSGVTMADVIAGIGSKFEAGTDLGTIDNRLDATEDTNKDWRTNEATKSELVQMLDFNDDLSTLSKFLLYVNTGNILNPEMSFQQFLQQEIPVIRVQQTNVIGDKNYTVFRIADASTYETFCRGTQADIQAYLQRDKTLQTDENGNVNANIYFGKVKIADAMFAKGFDLALKKDSVSNLDSIEMSFNPNMEPQTRIVNLPVETKLRGGAMAGYTKKYYADDKKTEYYDPEGRLRKEVVVGKKSDNFITKTITYDENGKIVSRNYKYPTVKRNVAKSKYEGTNLQYFVGRNGRVQLSNEMQKFVLNENLDPVLQNKINGSERGTLKRSDVMDYLRTITLEADNPIQNALAERTFKAIKEVFFPDSAVKSLSELEDLTLRTSEAYALNKIFEQVDPAILDTKAKDFVAYINGLAEIALKNYKSMYNKYLDSFKSRGVQNDATARMQIMLHFDDTVGSLGRAATTEWGYRMYKSTGDINVGVKEGSAIGSGERVKSTSTFATELREDVAAMPRSEKIDAIANAISADESLKFAKQMMKLVNPSISDAQIESLINSIDDIDNLSGMIKSQLGRSTFSDADIDSYYILADYAMSTGETAGEQLTFKGLVRNEATISNSIRYKYRKIMDRLNDKSRKLMLQKASDPKSPYYGLFDSNGKINDELIHDKKGKLLSADKLQDVDSKLEALLAEVRSGAYVDRKTYTDYQKGQKELRQRLEQIAQQKPADPKFVRTYNFAGNKIQVDSNQEIPAFVRVALDTQYTNYNQTVVKGSPITDEAHLEMNYQEFIDNMTDKVLQMDQATADAICDWYLTAKVSTDIDQLRVYLATEQYTLAALLKMDGKAMFKLSPEKRDAIQHLYDNIASMSGAGLAIQKAILNRFDPYGQAMKSLARRAKIDPNDPDIEPVVEALGKAFAAGDYDAFVANKDKLYELVTQKAQYKASALERLLAFERMAMLSSPGTWIRNWTTNYMIQGFTKANDAFVRRVAQSESAVSKLFQKLYKTSEQNKETIAYTDADGKVLTSEQYNLAVIKPTQESIDFVKEKIVKSGVLAAISDAVMKYDTRTTKSLKATSNAFAVAVIQQMEMRYGMDNTLRWRWTKAMQQFIYKMLSDEKWVNTRFVDVVAKTLTADNVDLTKNLSGDVARHVADAYVMAAEEYMHKRNFITDLENKMYTYVEEHYGTKKADIVNFMYKQIFPFAGASLNWAIEGLKYSPVGLANAIYRMRKLENTIERMEKLKQQGKRTTSPQFAKYLVQKDISKGLVGSIGSAIAIALAALGIVRFDDDDYDLKMRIGDVEFGLSDIYGMDGFLMGASIANGFNNFLTEKDFSSFVSIFTQAASQLFDNFSMADFYNSTRYSSNLGDFVLDKLLNIPTMLVPAFWKMFVNVTKTRNMQFSDKLLGRLARVGSTIIPFIGNTWYAVDPYTGEKQIKYLGGDIGTFIANAINKNSPIKVEPLRVSEYEKEALRLGINKSALRGDYTINGEKISLSTKGIQTVNEIYGQLNNEELGYLFSNKRKYTVENEKGKRVMMKYSQMTDAQKKAVIKRIMLNNGSVAKAYILTQAKDYKYYASGTEYSKLMALGAKKNVYRSSATKQGFVK